MQNIFVNPTGKYILLEYIQETHTRHMGGVRPFVNINPAENYSFDEDVRTLKILSEPDFQLKKDGDFKMILGVKWRVSGDIANSERGKIIPIEKFPYEVTQSSDEIFGDTKSFTIVNVDRRGNIFLKYDDEDIEIKPNSETRIQGKPKIKNSLGAKIRFSVTYIFKNHGFCRKGNIILQKAVGN